MTSNLREYILPYFQSGRLVLFPKRRPAPVLTSEQWLAEGRRRWRWKKTIDNSIYHWYTITFKDGRREIAYLTTGRGDIRRGLLFRQYIPYWAIERIDVAF